MDVCCPFSPMYMYIMFVLKVAGVFACFDGVHD